MVLGNPGHNDLQESPRSNLGESMIFSVEQAIPDCLLTGKFEIQWNPLALVPAFARRRSRNEAVEHLFPRSR